MAGPLTPAPPQTSELEVQSEALGACLYQLTVTVPAARVNQEIEEVLRAAGRRVKMPGFRPGHVPLHLLRKALGPGIQEDVRSHLVEHVSQDALRQSGLDAFRILEVEPKEVVVEENQAARFGFRVETFPKIELPPWDELKLQAEATVARPDQVAAAQQQLSHEHARFEDAPGQALDEQHLVACDLRFRRADQEVAGAEGVRLGLGSPLYGSDPARFAEIMKGAKAGEERVVPVQFLEGFSEPSWVGGEGEALLAVRQVVKPRPATVDEVVADLAIVGGPEVLNQRLAEQITRQNEAQERDRLTYELLEQIGRMRPFDLPARLLDDEVAATLKNHAERLEKQGGMNAEEAGKKAEEAREQIRQDATRRLRHYFLVRRVAAAESIRVEDEDLRRAYQALGERHQVPADAVQAYYAEQGMTGRLRGDILDSKVRARLSQIALERATRHAS